MRYIKSYKLFESISKEEIEDILVDLKDDGFVVIINDDYLDKYDLRITRPGSEPRNIPGSTWGGLYPGDVFIWKEIKDSIIRLNNWYYDYSGNDRTPGINYNIVSKLSKIGIKYNSSSPFRMYNSGVEFGVGWCKPEDFDKLGDDISFTSLRIEMMI